MGGKLPEESQEELEMMREAMKSPDTTQESAELLKQASVFLDAENNNQKPQTSPGGSRGQSISQEGNKMKKRPTTTGNTFDIIFLYCVLRP